ncbi:hypothetical protein [Sinorhizobium fredii]|uniref:Uncharacterized protein n=1 Tax=Rhizobium fredii TaxID=380 RepID=A0A2L0H485_RHIFR|nr:hypothetical protein [Sinorhizobium fredii]AUX76295.1 hypothetical protein NXT3_CH01723 [Sinorhizobium fredii]
MGAFDIIAVAAGCIIAVAALTMIFRQLEVSSGHGIVMGVAAVLLALPLISNFEWTGDGFKVTTKEVALELTEQVKQVREQQASLSQGLQSLNAVLQEASGQIAAIQQVLKRDAPNAETDLLKPTVDPEKFEKLRNQFEHAIQTNNAATEQLETLQQTITKDWDRQLDVLKQP